jgi:hypothetical protein
VAAVQPALLGVELTKPAIRERGNTRMGGPFYVCNYKAINKTVNHVKTILVLAGIIDNLIVGV